MVDHRFGENNNALSLCNISSNFSQSIFWLQQNQHLQACVCVMDCNNMDTDTKVISNDPIYAKLSAAKVGFHATVVCKLGYFQGWARKNTLQLMLFPPCMQYKVDSSCSLQINCNVCPPIKMCTPLLSTFYPPRRQTFEFLQIFSFSSSS